MVRVRVRTVRVRMVRVAVAVCLHKQMNRPLSLSRTLSPSSLSLLFFRE